MRPCLRQFLDLQVCNDLSTLCFRKISHFSFLMRLCSLSSPIGEDYPIYASPPETSFGCDGYIEVQSFLKIMFGLMFIVRSSRVTMPTPKLSARPSTSAPTLVTPTSSSTVSSAPTELSSTSSTSSVIGGSTLTARRFYKEKEKTARNWLRLTTAVQAEDLYGLNEEVAAAAAAATAAAAGFDKRISKKHFHRRSPRR